jgi:hypothetical protein
MAEAVNPYPYPCPRCGGPRDWIATPSTWGQPGGVYLHLVCHGCRIRWPTRETFQRPSRWREVEWEESGLAAYERRSELALEAEDLLADVGLLRELAS